jgi:diguanylate cyclase (GGDEF)-like protein
VPQARLVRRVVLSAGGIGVIFDVIERDTSATERTYVFARGLLMLMLAVLAALSIASPELFVEPWFLVGVVLLFASSLAYVIMRRSTESKLSRILVYLLPGDLLAMGLLLVGMHEYEDPVYAAFLALPVFYAFLLHRRDAWVVGPAAALVYVIGHGVAEAGTASPMDLFLNGGKAFAIVFLGLVSTFWAVRYREKQREILDGTVDKEELNARLQRRLGELQAVSEITDVVHSSLDFDRIGPLVLDIVSKVIDARECCMFVIDRSKGETLFTASVGMTEDAINVDQGVYALTEGMVIPETHFSCLSVLDHHSMMVVFCAPSEIVESLAAEDRLVLQAVASELVVAIENSQLYKLTKRLAITDELTGLYNYRYLQQRLDEEIERARRYHKDLSLLMIDIDDFKLFNDDHGHMAGDTALSDVAAVLLSVVREVDVVARYGGEEFSVILPETDAAGAFVVAEKIRETLSLYEFEDAGGRRACHLTCSVGLATYPSHAQDKEALLKLADNALYRAKETGKDRVRSPAPRKPVRLVPRPTADDSEERIS